MKPTIRDLGNGDYAVDFGRRWFRVFANGRIIKKQAKNGKVKQTEASPYERELAMRHLTIFWGENF